MAILAMLGAAASTFSCKVIIACDEQVYISQSEMAYHGADQMYPGLSKRDFAPGFIMYPRQEMMKKEYNLLNTERSK